MTSRIFIWGSCVSRDTCEFLEDRQIVDYFARQSLISAGTRVDVPMPEFESPFQRRVCAADRAGSVLDEIQKQAENLDLLMLDLCDERLGVFRVGEDGFFTNSVEQLRARSNYDFELIRLGTSKHMQLWLKALDSFVTSLKEWGIFEKTLVVAPDWAAKTDLGKRTPSSFGLTAKQANRIFDDYLDEVSKYGIRIIGQELKVEADSDHKWGLAPFHYTPEIYRALVREITDALTG